MNKLIDYTANLLSKYDLDYETILSFLEIPNQDMGDVALPCFKLAKILHKSPIEIANNLQNQISDPNLEKIESVNGFLNFTFKPQFISNTLLSVL